VMKKCVAGGRRLDRAMVTKNPVFGSILVLAW
jgi:hypothetical protein